MLDVNYEKPGDSSSDESPSGDSGSYKGVDFKWRGNGDLQAAGQLFTSRYTIERWNDQRSPIVLEIWDARTAGTLNRGGKVVDPMRAKFYNKGKAVYRNEGGYTDESKPDGSFPNQEPHPLYGQREVPNTCLLYTSPSPRDS